MSSVAAFGLRDTALSNSRDGGAYSNEFLSDVVLPAGSAGKVLVLDEAERSRVHSGYEWPPESKITEILRRIPVPLLWNYVSDKTLENEPKTRWRLNNGGEISTAALLAKHCKSLFDNTASNEQIENSCICIPSTFSEASQEYLLRELSNQGAKNTRLLWRDIAAIFAAIVKGEFKQFELESRKLGLLVIHASIDQIECSYRRLVSKPGGKYLIPERVRNCSSACGSPFSSVSHALGNLSIDSTLSDNSKWKLITTSDNLWKVVLDKSEQEEDLIFSSNWETLSLTKKYVNQTLATVLTDPPASKCWIDNYIDRSLANSTAVIDEESVHQCLSRAIKTYSGEQIDVVIYSGCMIENRAISSLIETCLKPVQHSKRIVISEESLCLGAEEFLRRLRAGEPTYYDYVTPLYLLIAQGASLQWFDLIAEHEARIDGGTPIKKTIKGKVAIDAGSDVLDISLHADPSLSKRIRAGHDVVEDLIGGEVPEDISEAEACYIRSLARELLETKSQDLDWIDEKESRKQYFEFILAELASPSEWSTVCRTLTFELPSKAPEETDCILEVEASPTSGRAKMTLQTTRSNFARNRKFPADYSTMKSGSLKDIAEEKNVETGWPQLLETPVYPKPYSLPADDRRFVDEYLSMSPTNRKYIPTAQRAFDLVVGSGTNRWRDEFNRRVKHYNESGVTSGYEITNLAWQLSNKLDGDFSQLSDFEVKRKLLTKASYLYSSCPFSVKQFAFQHKENFGIDRGYYRFLFPALCRVASGKEEQLMVLTALFNWIEYRKDRGQKGIPYNGLLGLLSLLRFKKGSESLISRRDAEEIVDLIAETIEKELREENIKFKFYQSVLAFLYLLRVRRAEPGFLSPGSNRTSLLEAKFLAIGQQGINLSTSRDRAKRIKEAVDTIIGYINYTPNHSIIAQFVEEAGDD